MNRIITILFADPLVGDHCFIINVIDISDVRSVRTASHPLLSIRDTNYAPIQRV